MCWEEVMQDQTLRLHRYEPASRVNGPGLRAVVWVQGCGLGCPGCFNPETHDFKGGEIWTVEKLAEKILRDQTRLQGLTISGGEPMNQHSALARLVRLVRAGSNLSVLVFTGYTWDELEQFKGVDALVSNIDLLIAGRYNAAQRMGQGLIGSANKTVHFITDRYGPADLENIPEAEVILSPNGEIYLSGIDPLQW
jgi:anaerobic ribonucleoside-triphosphate reductase activating protein